MTLPRQQAAGSESSGSLGGLLSIGTDIVTRRLGFGAMRLCGPSVWGEPLDPPAAKRVLRRVVELGITLIDTADAYGPEVNERLIADALHPYPDHLVIATKDGLTRPRREAWIRNGRPEHLRSACEGSLRRLKLQRIDLYQLHAPDPAVALEESVGALADLQTEGKIHHIGLSNVSVDELRRALRLAPIVSVQNRYNISDRASDDVLRECERLGSPSFRGIPWRREAPPAAAMPCPGWRSERTLRPCRSPSPGCCRSRRSWRRSPARLPSCTSRKTSPQPSSCFRNRTYVNCDESRMGRQVQAGAAPASRCCGEAKVGTLPRAAPFWCYGQARWWR